MGHADDDSDRLDDLLALKRRGGEQEWLPARPVLNAFLGRLLQKLSQAEPGVGEPAMHLLDDLLAETRRRDAAARAHALPGPARPVEHRQDADYAQVPSRASAELRRQARR